MVGFGTKSKYLLVSIPFFGHAITSPMDTESLRSLLEHISLLLD